MIVVFSHPKGGVGKSMLAFNYAVFLRKKGIEVAIIDLDGQHSISNFNKIRIAFNVTPTLNIKTYDNTNELVSFLNQVSSSDMVIIDTGGFDSSNNRIALAFADKIITPVSDSPVEIMRLLNFSNILDEIEVNLNHKLKTYVVLNRIHPSLKNIDYVKEPFKDKPVYNFLNSVVRDRVRFKFSVSNGNSVFDEPENIRDEKAIFELNSLYNEIENIIIS
ncbi:partitioning protein, ParA family (plasmid) [Campylobacter corcagiensis]|uniref:Partitioning protein, ParA family n=1 Tax=Campylobacter corcagiensis TaxID=1448857 RepID=A0A6M8N889_9BACT|nr:ParA family protein [Campylobacter corcagiensis]QKF65537.1 partitioning protein, ParA family [Campylobacter corcagiensis]QKF65583.1 partitioning protein, ParA family [Campylobacter corcagiensis]